MNAARHGVAVRATFRQADFARLPPERFDLVVANPPYIADADVETLDPDAIDRVTLAVRAAEAYRGETSRAFAQAKSSSKSGFNVRMRASRRCAGASSANVASSRKMRCIRKSMQRASSSFDVTAHS